MWVGGGWGGVKRFSKLGSEASNRHILTLNSNRPNHQLNHPLTELPTHSQPTAPQFLPHADLVVVMLDGRIVHTGSYDELTAAGVDLAAFVPIAAADHPDDESSASEQQPTSPLSRRGSSSSYGQAAAATVSVDSAARRRQGSGRLSLGSRQSGDDASWGGAAPQPASAPSVAAPQLMQVPPTLNRFMMEGGSFASHKPTNFGTRSRFDRIASLVRRMPERNVEEEEEGEEGADEESGAAAKGSRKGSGKKKAGSAFANGKAEEAEDWDGEGDDDDEDDDEKGAGGKKGGAVIGGKRWRRGRIVKVEHRAKGRVKRLVYLVYLSAWGPLFLLPIAITVGESSRVVGGCLVASSAGFGGVAGASGGEDFLCPAGPPPCR